jgi:hypothetical protein
VLEISINGGAFADILAAGGSFVEGGYNGSITVTDNVLTGRAAWTGNSGGFITTTVVLPAASYGQNAQLRWRTAYDTGTNPGGGGQRVDTISIYPSTRFCCSGACVLTCPADISVPNDLDECGAVVPFTPTYSGNCGTVTSNPQSGSFFPVGTTEVTVTAARLNGSSDSCTFDVTVNDTQLPAVSTPTTNPNTLWPPNHQMVDVAVNYTATDNCPLTCVLTVSSNEPIDGLGDGDTAPDWQVIDDHNVRLRAERSGKGNGRIYTITTTCTDASNNTNTKTSTVLVPKSMKGGSWAVIAVENKGANGGTFSAAPMLDPRAMGMVNFDFDSKTVTPSSSRSGSLINLLLGKLEFRTLGYDSKTVAGARTQFKGSGTVNNLPGYRYILTVIDGQAPGGDGVDKFRLRVWNEKTGETVFDNQMGAGDDADPTNVVGDGASIKLP